MRLIEFLGIPEMEEELLKHGGLRKGAGRKPLADGIVRRLFALTPRHIELLEAYRQRHGLASGSAAMRHMIEGSEVYDPATRQTVEPGLCPNCHAPRTWEVFTNGAINSLCRWCGRRGANDNLADA